MNEKKPKDNSQDNSKERKLYPLTYEIMERADDPTTGSSPLDEAWSEATSVFRVIENQLRRYPTLLTYTPTLHREEEGMGCFVMRMGIGTYFQSSSPLVPPSLLTPHI